MADTYQLCLMMRITFFLIAMTTSLSAGDEVPSDIALQLDPGDQGQHHPHQHPLPDSLASLSFYGSLIEEGALAQQSLHDHLAQSAESSLNSALQIEDLIRDLNSFCSNTDFTGDISHTGSDMFAVGSNIDAWSEKLSMRIASLRWTFELRYLQWYYQ